MSNTIKVYGGKPLKGTVQPIPNKNAILKVIPASLLTSQPIICKNFPDTTDLEKMLQIAQIMGVSVEKKDTDTIINASTLSNNIIDPELGGKIRAAILFVGPLLHKFGIARVPMPGGCTLGKRSISAHLEVFSKVGVEITFEEDHVVFKKPLKNRTQSMTIWQSETSVTATENILIYLAGISAETTIINAACEPHVVQLCNLLVDMGAKIQGIGSNKITIFGSSNLNGATFIPEPDFVDIGGYIVAAAITKGNIIVKNGAHPHISGGLINIFSKFGIKMSNNGNDLHIDGTGDLEIDVLNSGFPMADESLPKFNPGPWPNFPVDVLPVVVTLACKTKGRLLINNWMYETGLNFVQNLNDLGANIQVLDNQKIIVNGPVKFKNGEVVVPDVIQACKAVFLATLADDCETVVHGTDILKRRYPDIFTVYKSLGAQIELI